jgi:tRNA(fMet)-specific endonuclease VapC
VPVYMLDTDISSYIMKRSHDAVLRRLQKVPIDAVCISVITKSELLFGVEVSARRQQDQAALEDYLRHVEVLDFPDEAAVHYAQIRAALKVRGEMIGANDLFIAAHARSLEATLVTNNIDEFSRVQNLKIENWTQINGRGDRIRTCDSYVPNVIAASSNREAAHRFGTMGRQSHRK